MIKSNYQIKLQQPPLCFCIFLRFTRAMPVTLALTFMSSNLGFFFESIRLHTQLYISRRKSNEELKRRLVILPQSWQSYSQVSPDILLKNLSFTRLQTTQLLALRNCNRLKPLFNLLDVSQKFVLSITSEHLKIEQFNVFHWLQTFSRV